MRVFHLERGGERGKNFAGQILKKVLPIIVANFFEEKLVIPRFARVVFPPEDLKVNYLVDSLQFPLDDF